MGKLLLIALMASLPSGMFAQHAAFRAPHFSGRPAWGPFRSGSISAAAGFSRPARIGRGYSGSFLSPFDPFYTDYLESTGYPVSAEPPVIILQAPSAQSVADRVPAQPLMIELRGNTYVQVSGDSDPQSRIIDASSISDATLQDTCHPERNECAAKRGIRVVEGPRPASRNSAALLIFRDGHREEISSYTISNGTLYASLDYATSGAWTRKIELTSLNLPETVNFNHSRGVQFRVPQASNEVIVGP